MDSSSSNTAKTSTPAWVNDTFTTFEQGLNGTASLPFHSVRKSALSKFKEIGLPTTKNEEWKYTNLAKLARISFGPAAVSAPLSASFVEKIALTQTSARLVFVNGHFDKVLSTFQQIDGLSVAPLSQALKQQDALGSLVQSKLAKLASIEHPFIALNTAFIEDGAVIHIQSGKKISEPIQLIFVTSAKDGKIVSNPRVLIVADDNSSAHIVETYVGDYSGESLTNAVTEIVVGENSTLDHYKLQLEGENAFHISTIQADIRSYGNFSTHSFNFGGLLTRNEVNPTISGNGVNCVMNGLSMGTGEQLIDNHTVLDHAIANSESRELYKGIYDDKSAGVFCGSIIVRPDAQKTNAIQSNQSLLLSDTASINAKPQLKIWADDVKCTHGATIGQLDDEGLFYLRSRGVSKSAARGMLIHAFASDVLTTVKIPQLREMVEAEVSKKLRE